MRAHRALTLVCGVLAALLCSVHVDAWEVDYLAFAAAANSTQGDRAPTPTRASASQLELHWYAPFLSGGGYASEALAFLRGAVEVGLAAAAGHHGDTPQPTYLRGLSTADASLLQHMLARHKQDDRAVAVCHSEPGAWHLPPAHAQRYASGSTCPPAGAAYKVARTMFETDRLPDAWLHRLQAMDEVWVPSHAFRDILRAAGVADAKVVVVPEPVDTEFFTPAHRDLAQLGMAHWIPPRTGCARANDGSEVHGSSDACPFRFLTVGKWERRKNFETLIRAVFLAFANQSATQEVSAQQYNAQEMEVGAGNAAGQQGAGVAAARPAHTVELYVLTSAYHSTADFDAALQRLMEEHVFCSSPSSGAHDAARAQECVPRSAAASLLPRIKLLHDIPQTRMASLYASMDAYVSTTRGEGWGRPQMEAMACGLPVISTAWGGSTEFMNSNNSYPLRVHHLAPIPDGMPFAGHMQAEVSAADAAQLMTRVVEQRAEAAAIGAAAAADMRALYSLRSVGRFVQHQVARISDEVRTRWQHAQSRAFSATEEARAAAEEMAVAEARAAARLVQPPAAARRPHAPPPEPRAV